MITTMAAPEATQISYGDPSVWALQPGDAVERQTLQARYGGRALGAIGPSRISPNVLVFSDPAVGEPNGHFDGWRADGCFHLTGEGQHGDQEMKSGNAAILNYAADGRALRLFLGARGRVVYEGEFGLAEDRPWYVTDAPETPNGPLRSVIVFRMSPLNTGPKPSSSPLDRVAQPGVENVAVGERWSERVFLAPRREPSQAEKRELEMVLGLRDHLLAKGHDASRVKIVPRGEAKPLFADLMDQTTRTLYVAKATVERGAVRVAIGQLLDYGRFFEPRPRLAVLLPSMPRPDLAELLQSLGIDVVWRDGKRFIDAAGVTG